MKIFISLFGLKYIIKMIYLKKHVSAIDENLLKQKKIVKAKAKA